MPPCSKCLTRPSKWSVVYAMSAASGYKYARTGRCIRSRPQEETMATTTVVRPSSAQRMSKALRSEWVAGYFFASPFIIGFLVFTAYPMLYAIYLSLHRWDLIGQPQFVGLANFVQLFTDPLATLSLYNTAFYTVFAVPFQIF